MSKLTTVTSHSLQVTDDSYKPLFEAEVDGDGDVVIKMIGDSGDTREFFFMGRERLLDLRKLITAALRYVR